MSEIREGFGELDKIFVDNVDVKHPMTLNGNLNSLSKGRVFRLDDANRTLAMSIVSRGDATDRDEDGDRIKMGFKSYDIHTKSNMEETLHVLKFATTTPELQRELRKVDPKEFPSFHQTTFIEGKTHLVDINLVGIKAMWYGVIQNLYDLLDFDPEQFDAWEDILKIDIHELSKEKQQTAELFIRRSVHYGELMDDGYIWFILDGQTRGWVWGTCYSDDSTVEIRFPKDSDAPRLTKIVDGTTNQYAEFGIEGVTFAGMNPHDREAIRRKIGVRINSLRFDVDDEGLEMGNPKDASRAFVSVNDAVQVPRSLGIINDADCNGLTNQVDRFTLHPNRAGTEEYAHFVKEYRFDEFIENWYTSQNTKNLFDRNSNGFRTFVTMMAVRLFGDRMNCPYAEGMSGDVLFTAGTTQKGFNGMKPILAGKTAELIPNDYTTLMNILHGMSIGVSNTLKNGCGTMSEKFSMATKVNSVLFSESMLTRVEIEDRKVLDWVNLYTEFYPWDAIERTSSQYLTFDELRDELKEEDFDVSTEVIEAILAKLSDKKQKNSKGYYQWGLDQKKTDAINLRKKHIDDHFITPNWDKWIQKGYIL